MNKKVFDKNGNVVAHLTGSSGQSILAPESDGVVVPGGVEYENVILTEATNFKLPTGLRTRCLDLFATDGARIPDGINCEVLVLDFATNIQWPKHGKIKYVYLSDTDGVNIPNGLGFEEIVLCGATNFTLPMNLRLKKLDLNATDGAEIPYGLKCDILQTGTRTKWPQYADIKQIFGEVVPKKVQATWKQIRSMNNAKVADACCAEVELSKVRKMRQARTKKR